MMRFLAMTTAVLSLAAATALANPDPLATGNPSASVAATAPAEATVILARRHYYRYGGRRCMERLGYGRTGSYGCG